MTESREFDYEALPEAEEAADQLETEFKAVTENDEEVVEAFLEEFSIIRALFYEGDDRQEYVKKCALMDAQLRLMVGAFRSEDKTQRNRYWYVGDHRLHDFIVEEGEMDHVSIGEDISRKTIVAIRFNIRYILEKSENPIIEGTTDEDRRKYELFKTLGNRLSIYPGFLKDVHKYLDLMDQIVSVSDRKIFLSDLYNKFYGDFSISRYGIYLWDDREHLHDQSLYKNEYLLLDEVYYEKFKVLFVELANLHKELKEKYSGEMENIFNIVIGTELENLFRIFVPRY